MSKRQILFSVVAVVVGGTLSASAALAQVAAESPNSGASAIVGHVGNGGGAAASTSDEALSNEGTQGCDTRARQGSGVGAKQSLKNCR